MLETDKDLLAEIINEYEAAPHREKQAILSTRLPLLGISRATFYQWKNNWGHRDYDRKRRADKGRVQHPERLIWTKEIIRLKHSKYKGVRSLTTADALRLAVQWGRVPPEAMSVPEGTFNRLARELGLTKAPRRGRRFESPYFNHLHQVDASGSEYIYPDRIENGEWILKFRIRPMKNKPSSEGRRKLWYWGLVDDFSGARISRTVVAPGESALDGIEFLKFAWSNDPAHAPIQGIPFILYMDNGVLARHHAMKRFAENNTINLRTHEPDRAQATGKVETGWKDLWQRFEAQFIRLPDYQKREISQNELNLELSAFIRESNQRHHRRLPMSKTAAWLASARERGGLVDIDASAWDKIFRDWQRTLDDAGCFELHGEIYQVKEIHACKVVVYQQMVQGAQEGSQGSQAGTPAPRVLVEDRRDGKRYHAQPWVVPVAGDFHNTAHTPLENLLKEDPWADQRPPLPTWQKDSNVVALPVRPAEVRQSGFVMPSMPAGGDARPTASLEELAAGVEIIQRQLPVASCQLSRERLFETPLERYEFILPKELRGERLTPEEVEFMAWFRGEYRETLVLVGVDLEKRAHLKAVEA